MGKSSSTPDEERQTLRVSQASELRQSVQATTHSTTGQHRMLVVRSGESDDAFFGHDVKTIRQQMTLMLTAADQPMSTDRKSLAAAASRHKEEEPEPDFESIVKIRLFLATAVLWLLWLLVYVILSHWRLI